MRQREVGGTEGGALAGAVAVEAQDRLIRHSPQQRELVLGQRGAKRRDRARKTHRDQRDHVDIAFCNDQRRAVMHRLTGGGDVVEIVPLVKQRGFRRVEILRRDVLLQRAAAEGDDAAALIGDRKHHAIAETIVRHRNVVAMNQQSGLDHVLDRNAELAEMLLQREAIRRRITHAKPHLRRRLDRAVGEIAARLGAGARSQRVGEELGGQIHHVIERLAALFVARGIGGYRGDRHAGLRGGSLHRLDESEALGLHDEVENVAVLAAGETVIEPLLVVDREGRRLFLLEGREPLELLAGAFQLHAAADDFRNRKAGAQFFKKLGREAHRFGGLCNRP